MQYNSAQNSEVFIYLYIDLFKAFDTVNQIILLRKLLHIGARGRIFNWFKTYLNNCKVFVAFDAMFSTFRFVDSDFRQGLFMVHY